MKMNSAKKENRFSPVLKAIVRKVLPPGIYSTLWWAKNDAGEWWRAVNDGDEWRTALQLVRLRRRMYLMPPGSNETEGLFNYTVHINNGRIFYVLYKDIFIKRVYHFEAQRPDPLILDLGSHIGLAILYFKHLYPQARIIGFEPDPATFPYLKDNVSQNGLTGVQLVQAALAGQEGVLTFYSDGKLGSSLAEYLPEGIPPGWAKYEVPCVRLRDYLIEPVDFLKMNIEGAEWEVIADSEDRLHYVREMVVEYHHLPGLPRTLHKILDILHRHDFEYVVSDFGLDTYGRARPPVCLQPKTRYYRQIYARRAG